MGLNGTLPPDWGSDGGLQKLRQLWIDGNNLSGAHRRVWRGQGPHQVGGVLALGGDFTPQHCVAFAHEGMLLRRPAPAPCPAYAAAGTIPVEWTRLPSLEYVYVKPGNPKLCGPLPEGINFKVRLNEPLRRLARQPVEGRCACVCSLPL